jgi:hypothetical protein
VKKPREQAAEEIGPIAKPRQIGNITPSAGHLRLHRTIKRWTHR